MKISFIGAGNVAWHLSQAFDHHQQPIEEVYSRSYKNADQLCGRLYHAKPKSDLDFSDSKAEVFFIAVSDDAIEEVLRVAEFPIGSTILHTSGTKSLDILIAHTKIGNIGVFYPLQTFSKSKAVDFRKTPICIEANSTATEQQLEKLAFSICENVCFYNSEDRKVLHLAAVFACNFTNHMLTLSKQIVEKEGLDFAVLKPLIEETISKAIANGPAKSQTGPAARNDQKTIAEHEKMLNDDGVLSSIYATITESILARNYWKK